MAPRAQGAHDARSHLFTVRLWPEEIEGERLEWRDKIQYAANGETLYFRAWESMLAFLQQTLDTSISNGEQVKSEGRRTETDESRISTV
jgi:subtilisin-like proprotein convertase family protein